MNALPAYQALTNLEKSIHHLRNFCLPPHADYDDLDEYRRELRTALESLKTHSMLYMASNNTMGFHIINGIPDLIKEICGRLRLPDMNEVFWDELANHYPPSLPTQWLDQNLSPRLQLKLSFLAIEQRTKFGNTIEHILENIPDEHFMEALTGLLTRLSMPYRKFELSSIDDALVELKYKLESMDSPSFHAMAAEHILAHQNLYFPIVKKLMTIHDLGNGPDKRTATETETMEFVDKLLALLDNTPDDIRELRASETSTLPGHLLVSSIRNTLALPAEFLVTLYEGSQHPTVMQWAEFSLTACEGRLPFKHFERIGLVKSPEWHMSSQESAKEDRLMFHFEHAIHTPGIDLLPRRLATIDYELPAKAFMEGIRVLEHVDLSISDAKLKAQVMFDWMLILAQKPGASATLMDAVKASSIDPHFFAKHPKLRGELLENKLGL
jgi:hypothetical protein